MLILLLLFVLSLLLLSLLWRPLRADGREPGPAAAAPAAPRGGDVLSSLL